MYCKFLLGKWKTRFFNYFIFLISSSFTLKSGYDTKGRIVDTIQSYFKWHQNYFTQLVKIVFFPLCNFLFPSFNECFIYNVKNNMQVVI